MGKKIRVHVHVHTRDGEEHWITMHGSHVLVSGEGKVEAGAGGTLTGQTVQGAGEGGGGSAKPRATPAEQSAALEEYSKGSYESEVGGYTNLQSMLRHGKPSTPSGWNEEKGQKHLAALRSAFESASLPKATTAYRGVRVKKGEMASLLNAKPGDVLEDKGVTSTSTSKEVVARKFSKALNRSDRMVQLTIEVPAGAKAIPIAGEEKELALAPDTKLEITKRAERGGILYLHAKVR